MTTISTQAGRTVGANIQSSGGGEVGNSYTIQGGDTLSGIAAAFGVPMSELQALNNIKKADEIRAGKKLRIPQGAEASEVRKSVAEQTTTGVDTGAQPQIKVDPKAIDPKAETAQGVSADPKLKDELKSTMATANTGAPDGAKPPGITSSDVSTMGLKTMRTFNDYVAKREKTRLKKGLTSGSKAAGSFRSGAMLTSNDSVTQGRGVTGLAQTGADVAANVTKNEKLADKLKTISGSLSGTGGALLAVSSVKKLKDPNVTGVEKLGAAADLGWGAQMATKAGADLIAKKAAGKTAGLVASKVASKAAKIVPGLNVASAVANTAIATKKAIKVFDDPKSTKADKAMAALDVATEAVGAVPLVGPAISLAGDAAELVYANRKAIGQAMDKGMDAARGYAQRAGNAVRSLKFW